MKEGHLCFDAVVPGKRMQVCSVREGVFIRVQERVHTVQMWSLFLVFFYIPPLLPSFSSLLLSSFFFYFLISLLYFFCSF